MGSESSKNSPQIVTDLPALDADNSYDEAEEELMTFIWSHMYYLSMMINTQYGLIETLSDKKVLTRDQVELISQKPSIISSSYQLLEEILTKEVETDSDDFDSELFLQALDSTQHKHVANFIRGKGEYSDEFGDEWPLAESNHIAKLFDSNYTAFVELVDLRTGLLDEMLEANCINEKQLRDLESCDTDNQRNELLFQILRYGSLSAYRLFTDCLVHTKQHEVVSLLATKHDPVVSGEQTTTTTMIDEQQKIRLSRNHENIIRLLDTKTTGLLDDLWNAECITWRQKEYIESSASVLEINRRLLEMMSRSSERDFDKFIECLKKTGQKHIAEILSVDLVVAHIVAKNSSDGHLEQLEKLIADLSMAAILRGTWSGELIAKHVNDLRNDDVELAAVNADACGIGLFYLCKSFSGLHCLHELYSSEVLKNSLQAIFGELLKTSGSPDLIDLRIDVVLWEKEDFNNCASYLCSLANLPALSQVYQLAKQKRIVAFNDENVCGSLPLQEFPLQIVERILIKAAGKIFTEINRIVPRAEVLAVATLSAVSHMSWTLLRDGHRNKYLLKSFFRFVCRPFRSSPTRLATLQVETGGDVVAVAEFNGQLYVACEDSNTIQVFASKPPFGRLEKDLNIDGLHSPLEMICTGTGRLYIADYNEPCAIWRMNLTNDDDDAEEQQEEHAERFIVMEWWPSTLSALFGRLLVTPRDGESLYQYADDGSELNHVVLPDYMYACHAVQTGGDTYIVCHRNRFIDDTRTKHGDSVSQVDVHGKVVRRFSNPFQHPDIQFNWPQYMVLYDDNDCHGNSHAIVADRLNKRIVSLDLSLQFKRVLMTSQNEGQPLRICLSSTRKFAFVHYYHSNCITVDKILV